MKILILLFIMPLLDYGPAFTATYYVATDGDDDHTTV